MKTFYTENGTLKRIRVTDNGGCFDRYDVIFLYSAKKNGGKNAGIAFSESWNPLYHFDVEPGYNRGKRIPFETLPKSAQEFSAAEYAAIWGVPFNG